MAYVPPIPNYRGKYILDEMAQLSLGGDTFYYTEEVFHACQRNDPNLNYAAFRNDLIFLQHEGVVCPEGRRLYLERQLCYKDSTAQYLAGILSNVQLPSIPLPRYIMVGDLLLSNEQQSAVYLALSNRLSLLFGSAGTGKTTLIKAILDNRPHGNAVICAPTGKAARNLTERTGYPAHTVHGALGMVPDEFFLQPITWPSVKLVIMDEAGTATLEMLAGILSRVPYDCRVVLVGDPYQLQSVGAGNLLPDLLELGTPAIHLQQIHRQSGAEHGLLHNVTRFHNFTHSDQLILDDSFILKAVPEEQIAAAIRDEAVRRYLAGENVQVLSPYNSATDLSVLQLNLAIREQVNPPSNSRFYLQSKRGTRFYDGDRVMIIRNDRDQNCNNGDIGTLRIHYAKGTVLDFSVLLPDGRCPRWQTVNAIELLTLAYAITVHKSQGSEYDTVLFPASTQLAGTMNCNLLYTALTRARTQVILFGSMHAIDTAMQKTLRPRHSMLVTKTRMAMNVVA